MLLVIKLPSRDEQMALNRRRWGEILRDRDLARLPYRIETNAHGQIVMNPPPSGDHSYRQSMILLRLQALLGGVPLVECPISTIDGVKAADVGWYSDARFAQVRGQDVFEQAPEICVEVISPSNAESEMIQKKSLYFEAGAQEVWFCRQDGTMEFYDRDQPETRLDGSMKGLGFPGRI
jgi:Uma2 family endonuclease